MDIPKHILEKYKLSILSLIDGVIMTCFIRMKEIAQEEILSVMYKVSVMDISDS